MFKKLFPAIIMLLISVILLTSSTYAWFSMNTTVTATGMSITAEADNPFLLIKENGKTGDWVEEATLSAVGAQLSLIHPTTINQAGMVWEYTTSTDPDDAQINNNTEVKALSGIESATGSTVLANNDVNFVLKQSLILKVIDDGANGTNLRIQSITFDTGTNTIAASGRVLLVNGTNYQLYKMVDGQVTNKESGSSNYLVASLTAGTEYTVDAFFYFDGTDTSAYTNNATDLSSVSANMIFEID